MKHRKTFEFFDTAEQAEAFCKGWNARQSRYMTQHHPAHFTPWTSQDGTEHKFIAWYHI